MEETRLQQCVQRVKVREGSDQRLRPVVTVLTNIAELPEDEYQSSSDGELADIGIKTVDDLDKCLTAMSYFEEEHDLEESDWSEGASPLSSDREQLSVDWEADDSMEQDADASAVDREADDSSDRQADEEVASSDEDEVEQPQRISFMQKLEQQVREVNMTFVRVPRMMALPAYIS